MPIRSPRGRSAAYRTLWQWPLRSPARLAVVVVAVVALGVGVSVGLAALRGSGGLPGLPSAAAGRATPGPTAGRSSPGPTALPPVPALVPTTLPLSQAPAAALQVARRWAGAWVRPPAGTTAQQWLDGLRATTTEEYLGVLSGVDPANIPATKVVGEPRAVQVAPRSVQVRIPTDSVTLLVTVIDTETGWRVSEHDRI